MKNMDIFSLTSVISFRKVNSYGRFQDTKTKGDNNYFKLFKAIKNGKVKTEAEAQEHLGIANRTAFLRFKGRYVRKILLHLESSNRMKYQGALLEHEIASYFSKARTLSDLGDMTNAAELYEFVYQEAVKIGYSNFALQSAIDLSRIYGYINIDKNKFIKYKKLQKKHFREFENHLNVFKYL